MGRFGWIVLLAWIAALVIGGCGGTEGDSVSVGSPREPSTLYLAGDGELTVVDVDSGRAEVHELAELAPGDPRYRIVRRGNELVLFGVDTYVVGSDLRSPPRKLADSSFFIPSADPDRIWVAVRDPSPGPVRAPETLREVAVDGRVTFPDVPRPSMYGPDAAVGDDLVFEDGRSGLELWNPATGEVTRRLPSASLGPAQGDLLAWCEPDGRFLHVLDVVSGSGQTIVPPQGFLAFDCSSGAFSPDGGWLAVPARAGGYEAERALALVDLETGLARAVVGSAVEPPYLFVAWSSGGDRVFVSGGDDGRALLQYRLGEPRAVPLPVQVRDFYGMAAR